MVREDWLNVGLGEPSFLLLDYSVVSYQVLEYSTDIGSSYINYRVVQYKRMPRSSSSLYYNNGLK